MTLCKEVAFFPLLITEFKKSVTSNQKVFEKNNYYVIIYIGREEARNGKE